MKRNKTTQTDCPRKNPCNARVMSAEELGTMSKYDLLGYKTYSEDSLSVTLIISRDDQFKVTESESSVTWFWFNSDLNANEQLLIWKVTKWNVKSEWLACVV